MKYYVNGSDALCVPIPVGMEEWFMSDAAQIYLCD